MTIVEFRNEARELAKEHWWNGAGLVVVAFLVATYVFTDTRNDYLLYSALVFFLIHSYISTKAFSQDVQERRHRQFLAVAYRESLMRQQDDHSDQEKHDRPHAGRNGRTPHFLPRFASIAGPPVAG